MDTPVLLAGLGLISVNVVVQGYVLFILSDLRSRVGRLEEAYMKGRTP